MSNFLNENICMLKEFPVYVFLQDVIDDKSALVLLIEAEWHIYASVN